MSELLELSWRTQVVFVGGYLAYVIAYSGRRSGHGPTDVIGIILCFGGLGLLGIGFLEPFVVSEAAKSKAISEASYLLGSIGVALPMIAAILWRGFLGGWINHAIRWLTRSKEDGLPTAWDTITQTKELEYAQLVVTLKSGVSYESFPLGNFNKLADGPCVLGSDGSIGMFVTYITEADGKGRPAEHLEDSDGFRMTYIPAGEIAEVDLRRKRKGAG